MSDNRSSSSPATHYAVCWRDHHACAVAEVERLLTLESELRDEIVTIQALLDDADGMEEWGLDS